MTTRNAAGVRMSGSECPCGPHCSLGPIETRRVPGRTHPMGESRGREEWSGTFCRRATRRPSPSVLLPRRTCHVALPRCVPTDMQADGPLSSPPCESSGHRRLRLRSHRRLRAMPSAQRLPYRVGIADPAQRRPPWWPRDLLRELH